MKKLLILYSCLYQWSAQAQWTENFSDGDFTANPVWIGNDSNWIVNNQLVLQSNCLRTNYGFYLVTSSERATKTEWEFSLKLSFNPSSQNHVDVYLLSTDSNVTAPNNKGYFVRLGSADDDVCLYRKDPNGDIKLIDGINGILNTSNNEINIKVIRTENNQWKLFRQINASLLFLEGNVTDSTYNISHYVGFFIKQSTSSFFQKHFFKSFCVKEHLPDTIPPSIEQISVINTHQIDILFNEAIDEISANNPLCYTINNNIGYPSSSRRDSLNHALIHLMLTSDILPRKFFTITIDSIIDIENNASFHLQKEFYLYKAQPFDIIIDEIMADPTPSRGLPEYEWIEIRNTTSFQIDLAGWKVATSSTLSKSMPAYTLHPDSAVVVCTNVAAGDMHVVSSCIAVGNFPALINAGDIITLMSPEGETIHTVQYADTWYQNELKKQGGWSLEMIDMNNPCSGIDNWLPSKNIQGGTPGKINSNDAINIDHVAPQLIRAFPTDSLHVLLYFNEPLDSQQASNKNNYHIDNSSSNIETTMPVSPSFNTVRITLIAPMQKNKQYEITVNGLTDCVKNSINENNRAVVAIPEIPDSGDVVINEVLFNPKTGSYDYVELYNNGHACINLKNLYIANRNNLKEIDNIVSVEQEDYLFFPDEYIVITENQSVLQREYYVPNSKSLFSINQLPAYNDDEGTVVVLNEKGNNLDELKYSEKWHFALLNNREGVSLERINVHSNTQDEHNWHSASSIAGYGTPGYKNSQSIDDLIPTEEIRIDPEAITPNNDGRNDIASIFYSFQESGYVLSVAVYDAKGRIVKKLVRNQLCGKTGAVCWNGLNDKNEPVPTGIYIIYIEKFNLRGKVSKTKKTVAVY